MLRSFGCIPLTIRTDVKMRLATLKQSFSLCLSSSNGMDILMKPLHSGCEVKSNNQNRIIDYIFLLHAVGSDIG